jgi:hypothetical protein
MPAPNRPTIIPAGGSPDLVPFEDLAGRQEIAERFGVTVTAVDTWRRRYPTFPAPITVLSGTPIWRLAAVIAWHAATPRKPGRPRGSRNG